jgi:cytidylate kinase
MFFLDDDKNLDGLLINQTPIVNPINLKKHITKYRISTALIAIPSAPKEIRNLKIKDLQKKELLSDKVGICASMIAKNKKIRNLVHNFQIKNAYYPPKKYNGSCLDGRDITYKIIPDANFKFFITANVKTRALRRYKELKQLKKK